MSTDPLSGATLGPLWHIDRSPRPPLDGDEHADVAIVGAGLTGLWSARYLIDARPDLRVVLVDSSSVGAGASGRNGGWCSALLPMSAADIDRSAGAGSAAAMGAAMRATLDEVERRCAEDAIEADLIRGGTITLARTPRQEARLRCEHAETARFDPGDRARWLTAAETAEHVSATGVLGAMFTPDCLAVHPGKLVHGLAAAVEQRGVTIFEQTTATSITPGTVTTTRGSLRAPLIIRATEVGTAGLSGTRRSIAPITSLIVATEPLLDSTWAEIGLASRATFSDGRQTLIYGQRTADGRLVLGGRGTFYRWGSSTSERDAANRRIHRLLVSTMAELFPVLDGVRITHRWSGQVAVARDWWCSAHFDPATGLAAAGAYAGDGVATTNLAGRTLAALATGSDDPLGTLAWVGHRSPRWEPEPLRWMGINSGILLAASIDRADRRGRAARWRRAALSLVR